MDEVLVDFVAALRRSGAPVSTAEALDAISAAVLVGLEHKNDLRLVLAAALVKREEDRERFERAFEAFFRIDSAPVGLSEAARAAIEARLRAAAEMAGASSGLAAASASAGDLEAMIGEAMRAAEIDRMVSSLQIGQAA